MIKFGTGGWRAIIGDEFTKANIQILARALAWKMKAEKKDDKGIVIGYDRRFLSKETVYWCSEVFAAENIKVYFVNRSVPTPTIMYFVMSHGFPYGMMVTASHNPAIYNGIKVFTEGGRDASEMVTEDIERFIQKAETSPRANLPFISYERALNDGLVIEFNPLNEYLDNVISMIDMTAIRNAELKIALDPMYGVSVDSLKTILLTARCDLDVINGQHDALFGGKLPAPSGETLRALQSHVVDHACDIGLATDGDADRLGVIDDTGRFLHPNEIIVLLYYYLVKYKKWQGPVVRNIATTHMLDRVAESFGQRCFEVPVGFKHISSKMNEVNALIGGESSGGLTVRGAINGKDGVYAGALLVEMCAVTGLKISELRQKLAEEYGTLVMHEESLRFPQEQKAEIYRILMEEKQLPEFENEIDHLSYLDGCKVYFRNGDWIIARFSGTEPLLRIFAEAQTEEYARAITEKMRTFLKL